MRHRQLLWLLLAAAASSACSMHAQVADRVRSSWQVLKEYDSDGYTYYVVKEGPRYGKIGQFPTGPVHMIYQVDTQSRRCKWGDALIDCEAVRRDPDLGPLITW